MRVVKIRVAHELLEDAIGLPTNAHVVEVHTTKGDPDVAWVYLESPIFPDRVDGSQTPEWKLTVRDGEFIGSLRPVQ